ncbi:MAG: MFS transporter [Nitrospinota bacterium]|nr:MFS transporter [Nitrospinota bacterium]
MMEPHSSTPEIIAQKTFRWDLARGFFRGVITSGTQTFGLFIAIRYFDAGLLSKSLIGSAPFMGMIFSLFLFHYAALTDLKKSICGSLPMVLSGVLLILSAYAGSLWFYTTCIVLGFMMLTAIIPFLTSIYHDNYPGNRRGSFYSKAVLVTVLVSIVSGFTGSSLMDWNQDTYRWILIALGVAGLGKAYAIWNMPSGKIEDHNHTNPFNHMKLVLEDRSFGYVLLTWFIMGFANLWVLPLRVDYLTSSAYGIEGSALFVATLITIVPDLMRAFSAPLLAKLFDRINFIVLRMTINIIFACGVGLFFLTKDPWVIGLASALIGIAFGGGTVAWGLWVTKYAPPEKVGSYMSVHVFLTGIRGTLGPLIGFWTVKQIGPSAIGLVSFSLMILATLMLIPEIKHGRGKHIPATQVTTP